MGECRKSDKDASGNADQVWRNWGPMGTEGRRPEVRIAAQFRETRSAFPDASEPDSRHSHCYLVNLKCLEMKWAPSDSDFRGCVDLF